MCLEGLCGHCVLLLGVFDWRSRHLSPLCYPVKWNVGSLYGQKEDCWHAIVGRWENLSEVRTKRFLSVARGDKRDTWRDVTAWETSVGTLSTESKGRNQLFRKMPMPSNARSNFCFPSFSSLFFFHTPSDSHAGESHDWMRVETVTWSCLCPDVFVCFPIELTSKKRTCRLSDSDLKYFFFSLKL